MVRCPLASGAQSKGDHVRRLVTIAAVGRPSSADAEIRSPCGYLQAH